MIIMWKFWYFFFAVIISVTGVKFRLPTTVKPIFYTLNFNPDENFNRFTGEVTIDVEINSIIDSIHLHNSNLTIISTRLDQRIANHRIHPEYELMEVFLTDRKIDPGNHKLYIKFRGEANRSGSQLGFFKTRHTGDDVLSFLALTKTQPTYTRRVFPCFDEPQMKSKFKITITAPDGDWVVLSNMRKIADFKVSKGHVHIFETSYLMSTYLVEFALSHFTFKEHKFVADNKVVSVRGYTPKANGSDYLASLKFVEYCLKFYGNYTRFHHEIPKLDLIEYDRIRGRGTENWGLVILTSRSLFHDYNSTYSTFSHLFAHEIAHFWFGNLVTNRWWDDLWLQEGFASFFANKIKRIHLEDTGNGLDLHIDHVLRDDEFDDWSRPIVDHVESTRIQGQFNFKVYTKSAFLLNMIESELGEEKFREAIEIYVRKFAFRAACSNDFIGIVQNLEPTSHFRSFIESYLYQGRYPLMYAREDENYYVLTQKPCVQPKKIDNPFGYKWTVPINYLTDSGEGTIWFHKDMDELKLEKNNTKWIKFNRLFLGLYKVVYSDSLWDKIIKHSSEIAFIEKELLILEADRLLSSCPKVMELIEKKRNLEGDFTEVSLGFMRGLYQPLINSNDSLSVKILEDYVSNASLTRTKRDSIANPTDQSDYIDGIKTCSEWIKNNLSKYLNET